MSWFKKMENTKENGEDFSLKQIRKNQYDYEYIRKLGKAELFIKENFLDENYERFLKYILDYFDKCDGEISTNLYEDITPEELKMLGDKEAYKKTFLCKENDCEQYEVSTTPYLNAIIKTRGITNRCKVAKMMMEFPVVWQFNHVAYENRYIYVFETYVEKLSEFLNPPNLVDFDAFRFHPMFYEFICNNFEEVFEVDIETRVKETGEVKTLSLTKLGKGLVEVSDIISKKLGEFRDYLYFQ